MPSCQRGQHVLGIHVEHFRVQPRTSAYICSGLLCRCFGGAPAARSAQGKDGDHLRVLDVVKQTSHIVLVRMLREDGRAGARGHAEEAVCLLVTLDLQLEVLIHESNAARKYLACNKVWDVVSHGFADPRHSPAPHCNCACMAKSLRIIHEKQWPGRPQGEYRTIPELRGSWIWTGERKKVSYPPRPAGGWRGVLTAARAPRRRAAARRVPVSAFARCARKRPKA